MDHSDSTLPQALLYIHRLISNALVIDIVRGVEYLESGFPSSQTMHGYSRFNHCLTSMMHSHHQAEDLVAFPAFRKLLPLAPYAQFTAVHRQIEALLALIPNVLTDLMGDENKYGLRVLIIILRKVSKLWAAHIEQEEEYFSPGVITPTMALQLSKEIQVTVENFNHEHSRPPYWVVPFLLYHIRQEDQVCLSSYLTSINVDEYAH